MKIGCHLHRPAIVKSSYDDGGRATQVFEGVVAPNFDLILLSELAKESRKTNRRGDIPGCEPIVGVLDHVAPRELVVRLQIRPLTEPLELAYELPRSLRMPLVELD